VVLSTLLAPIGVATAQGPDAAGSSGFTIPVSDASELSGLTAQVSAGGSGLNLRADPSPDAAVVTTLADGTVVNLRIDTVDTVSDASGTRWWPVEVDGNLGWVSGFYLTEPGTGATTTSTGNVPLFKGERADVSSTTSVSGDHSFSWDGGSLTDATARVAANGDGLNLRSGPSRDTGIVTAIPDGTVVDLRIDMTDTVYDEDGVTRWWPVLYDNTPGWVAGSYLIPAQGGGDGATTAASTSDATTTAPPTDTQLEFDGGTLVDASAIVSTSGDNLLLRADPSTSSDILDRIPDGAVVDLRIDSVDTVYDADGVTRWWPVTFDGQDGWVSGFYLSDGTDSSSSAGSDGTSGSAETSAENREAFSWDGGELDGATAIVSADGDGANVRGEPDAGSDVITTVQDGTTVNLRIADVDSVVGPDGVTRWWPVEIDGASGWISGFNLSDGSGGDTASASTSDTSDTIGNNAASGSAAFPAGSTARVKTASGQGLRVRAAAGTGSEHLFSVAEGSEVTIVDGPVSFENSVNGWFEISANGSSGFADGDLLVLIATPVPTAAPVTPTSVPTEESTTASEQSQQQSSEIPTATDQSGADTESPLDDRPTETPAPEETETADSTQAPSGSEFIVPVDGAILTQGFGCSSLGFYPYNPDWGCGVHDGIDFAAPSYTPIVASADGTVTAAGWCDCGLGYYVEIDHGNGVHTIYGHMAAQPYVSVGQQVSQGETIGPVGSTGLSTGSHTHFMVQVNGVSQDPSRYLP